MPICLYACMAWQCFRQSFSLLQPRLTRPPKWEGAGGGCGSGEGVAVDALPFTANEPVMKSFCETTRKVSTESSTRRMEIMKRRVGVFAG